MKWCEILIVGMLLASANQARAQANYDESKVPEYSLPDPLVRPDGKKVTSADVWRDEQRADVLQLVREHVYGKGPSQSVTPKIIDQSDEVVDGRVRRQATLRLERAGKTVDLKMLMYLPVSTSQVPLFVGLNFMGNHTITNDEDVPITESWVRNDKNRGYVNNKASEKSRGSSHSRWPWQEITARGYGVATIYYGDIDPDFDDGFKNGVHGLFPDEERTSASWGTIAAWAWGLSRAMDALETMREVNPRQVAVMGHSRLGKTSLFAGAVDERFALVVSNNSGCGGAALSRRRFGEAVKRINTSFPHWFCDNFVKYNDNEAELPVDQHSLIALIAPRPVLICSAEKDRWADPRGEFLAGVGADGVYRLLGTDGMVANEWPGLNTPILSRIGYHIRPGGHDVKLQDWNVYMDFADRHFGRK